jgi:subtilisin family serine protease
MPEALPPDPSPGDASPSERVSIAIGLKRPIGGPDSGVDLHQIEQAVEFLRREGFAVTGIGSQTIVISGTARRFEELFHCKLERSVIADAWNYSSRFEHLVVEPVRWSEFAVLVGLVEQISIERPHVYLATDPCVALPAQAPRSWATLGAPFAAVSAQSPPIAGGDRLDVLRDVPRLLRADQVHRDGFRGRGVRVVMIDSGFAHGHPFFVANGFRSKVCLAPLLDPGSTAFDVDRRGHGTGESANLFAVAPEVELIGIKLSPDQAGDDSPLLAPFMAALAHRPHIISISLAYDLCDTRTRIPETELRQPLRSLAIEIRHAVEQGIVVVAGSGNGHFGFPAQMPEVIAAGGVFADDPRLANPASKDPETLRASNFASAFESAIFFGRHVPDCCGLVGEAPDGHYIVLPLPPGSLEDVERAGGRGVPGATDRTRADDGWAVFSGTSAAAPQLAGVCALMLDANPALKPADVKRILCASAREVDEGFASTLCIAPPGPPLKGKEATGAGLVDAAAAVKMALGEVKPGAHAGL